MIGSLDQVIHEAANDTISDGTEKIPGKHLDAVILDTAAEEQYRRVASPRPAGPPRHGRPAREALDRPPPASCR